MCMKTKQISNEIVIYNNKFPIVHLKCTEKFIFIATNFSNDVKQLRIEDLSLYWSYEGISNKYVTPYVVAIKITNSLNNIDYLYIVDSCGNCLKFDIKKKMEVKNDFKRFVYKILKEEGNIELADSGKS